MANEPANTPAQRRHASRYETNYRQYGRLQAKHAGGMVLKEGSVEVMACPFMSVFNGWFPTAGSVSGAPARLRAALNLYANTGQGMFCLVGPSAERQTLRPLLLEVGFKCTYWVPFMHLDFSNLPKRKRLPRGVTIEVVEDFSLFDREPHPWIGPPTTNIRRAKIAAARLVCVGPRAPGRQLVAVKGGKLIGCAMILCHRGVAGVYDVMVSKAHRRQGVGAALMQAACREACELGMTCAVLSASSQGKALYEQVGFTDAGRYGSYFLSRAGVRKHANPAVDRDLPGG